MKITHICLCGPVTDNMSYQDNLLPKYHKKMGYDVSVITSRYIWNDHGEIVVDNRNCYINEHDIKTIRIENSFNTNVNSKFKKYKNLYKNIENEKPDILFVHGVQFLDIKHVVKYIKKHPSVKLYVDNHADFSNSATNWLSKNLLHKVLWRYCAKLIEPYTIKFYGVLPARVNFLKDIYKLPLNKLELLVLGADDEKIEEANRDSNKKQLRNKLLGSEKEFLIVTGGKIDNAKRQVLNLMHAVNELGISNIKLVVYGAVIEELKDEVYQLAKSDSIEFIGWLNDTQAYHLFAASDLVVFPGRHSVYWEQVVAMGIPLVVKYWEGTTHIDIGGNCKFIYRDSIEEIKDILLNIFDDNNMYNILLNNAQKDEKDQFLYSKIAQESISY